MNVYLFSERSLWTMLHGIVLSGGALMALAAAVFALRTIRARTADESVAQIQALHLVWLTTFVAIMLWLTVFIGTYVIFPPYRADPPDGVADLRMYPRALLRSNEATAWLHSFAMETKEHVPWIAAMLSTAVAFVSARYRLRMLSDPHLNRIATWFLAIALILVAYVALLGVFINKVAPLQ